jgi:Bacterial Ig-like domain
MKSYPVVRSLSRLAAGLCLVACSSNNGMLFDEEPGTDAAGMEGVADEPPADPAPSADPPAMSPEMPPVADPPGDVPPSEQPTDDDLPLTGGFPTPPVSGTPDPPETMEEPPVPEPEGPVVVSVSPADGAVGVDNGQNIVITFSVPMDRAATESAYQSEAVPSGSVSFVWNDAGTELTIVPEAPLAYPVGDDPAQVPSRRVSFFISASATDLEGRSLSAPFESSFSLLRQVELRLFALQDRNLSGSFRSNDTYGAGACARAQINMCVGDVRVGNANAQYKGFISFELAELPEAAQSVSAELTLEITGMSGNPFGGLGGLVLEHASFEVIGAEAFSDQALDELGLIANGGGTGTVVSADIASAFLADRSERSLTQYRLSFEDNTDGDNTSDAIVSAWDTQTIDVSYLIP